MKTLHVGEVWAHNEGWTWLVLEVSFISGTARVLTLNQPFDHRHETDLFVEEVSIKWVTYPEYTRLA